MYLSIYNICINILVDSGFTCERASSDLLVAPDSFDRTSLGVPVLACALVHINTSRYMYLFTYTIFS